MIKKINKALIALLLLLSLFGMIACNSDTNIDTTYRLNVNEISESLLDEEGSLSSVILAQLAMQSTVELTAQFEIAYQASSGGPWGSRTYTTSITSQGTAIFINDYQQLLTNAHVVTLSDYESYTGFEYLDVSYYINFAESDVYIEVNLIDYDTDLDLAILEVNDVVIENLQYLDFYDLTHPEDNDFSTDDSRSLYYGEYVMAVGNANGYGLSVTTGVVSAPYRTFEDGNTLIYAIQTDAAINSGNSGGPLLNIYGTVIGINSFKIVTETSEGLGYAIPAYVIMDYLDSIQIQYSKSGT